jgi:hypothetical protein
MLQFATGLFARGPDKKQSTNAKKMVQSFKKSAEGDPELAQLCEFAEREDLLSNWAQSFCNIDTSGNGIVDEQEFKEYVEKNKSSAEILKTAMHNYRLAVQENESDSLDESASGGLTFYLFMRMMRTLHSKNTHADGRVYEFLGEKKAKTESVQNEDSMEKNAKIIEKAAGLLGGCILFVPFHCAPLLFSHHLVFFVHIVTPNSEWRNGISEHFAEYSKCFSQSADCSIFDHNPLVFFIAIRAQLFFKDNPDHLKNGVEFAKRILCRPSVLKHINVRGSPHKETCLNHAYLMEQTHIARLIVKLDRRLAHSSYRGKVNGACFLLNHIVLIIFLGILRRKQSTHFDC